MPDRHSGEGSPREKRDRDADAPKRSANAGSRPGIRYRWIGAIGAIAVITAIAVVVLTGGRSSTAKSVDGRASALQRGIHTLLAGIPQDGNALGSPSAPVTLQFFGDLECPTSREFTLEFLPSLIARRVRKGQLRIEYRSLKTATRNPEVFTTQQAAALAAGMQGKLWDYIEYFYHQQGPEGSGYVTEGYLRKLARQVPGLDVGQWGRDRLEPPLATEVAIDQQTAAGRGLYDTPSLLLGRSRGGAIEGTSSLSTVEPRALDPAIAGLLAGKASRQARNANPGTPARLEVSYRTEGDRERAPC